MIQPRVSTRSAVYAWIILWFQTPHAEHLGLHYFFHTIRSYMCLLLTALENVSQAWHWNSSPDCGHRRRRTSAATIYHTACVLSLLASVLLRIIIIFYSPAQHETNKDNGW